MAFEPAQHSFITLEGVDGAGKSTQARLLARALELAGYQVVSLREPGGTAISEKIRALLLDPANTAMGDTCELLLYEAARAQLVHEVIAPALAAGKVEVMVDTLPREVALVRSGQVRALAMASGTRSAALPEVPTAAEAGLPGYETKNWHGVFGATGTPAPIEIGDAEAPDDDVEDAA